MVESMKSVVQRTESELTVEERNLLSVAFKNVIGAKRASWRIVSSLETKEEDKKDKNLLPLIKEYKSKVRADLGTD